jgi:hypothetical protein
MRTGAVPTVLDALEGQQPARPCSMLPDVCLFAVLLHDWLQTCIQPFQMYDHLPAASKQLPWTNATQPVQAVIVLLSVSKGR